MLVKICGIKTNDEVRFLKELPIDYIGFVFCESKRQISSKKAKELIQDVAKTKIKTVGVFKDNTIEFVIRIALETKINVIQLHGKEDDNYIKTLKKQLKDKRVEIWKAISIEKDTDNGKIKNYKECNLFVLDGIKPGSGEVFDHDLIKEIKVPYILAGGITPDNIKEILQKVKPMGIDISSGVEENGIKTKKKVMELLKNLNMGE